jgi:hypothetical protein
VKCSRTMLYDVPFTDTPSGLHCKRRSKGRHFQ